MQRGFVDMAGKREIVVEMTCRKETFVDNYKTLNVNCLAVNHVSFVSGQLQKKGLSPIIVNQVKQLKCIKGASCVDLLSSVQPVINAHAVAQNLPLGARLNQFWKTWAALGASSKVIKILKEGYTRSPSPHLPELTNFDNVANHNKW